MASIESPQAKFSRASQQRDTLCRELMSLRDLNSFCITKDTQPDMGYCLYSFSKIPPIPDDIGLRIGEILYNYRCALDHLIWQLVLSAGNKPSNRNEFPIFNNIIEYEHCKGDKLKGVTDTVVAIVDALQPFNSMGEMDYWKFLWYLQILCNADKHRYLLLTRRTLANKIDFIWSGEGNPVGNYFAVPVEKGATFFRVKPDMNMQVHPRIEILFSNAPPDIMNDLPVENILGLIDMSVTEVFRQLEEHI